MGSDRPIRVLHIVRARHMAGSELMAFTLGLCQQRRGHEVLFAMPARCELREHLLVAFCNQDVLGGRHSLTSVG